MITKRAKVKGGGVGPLCMLNNTVEATQLYQMENSLRPCPSGVSQTNNSAI